MTWNKIVKAVSALAGGVGGWISGGWNPMLTVLAWCMLIDYGTGLIAACFGRSPKTESGGISSAVGFKGLARKAVILLVIALASLVDRITGNAVFQSAAVFYYAANEGISILENAVLIGVPVPDSLKNALDVMREKESSGK